MSGVKLGHYSLMLYHAIRKAQRSDSKPIMALLLKIHFYPWGLETWIVWKTVAIKILFFTDILLHGLILNSLPNNLGF